MKRVALSFAIAGMIATGAFAQPPRDGVSGRKGKGVTGEEARGPVGNAGAPQGGPGQRSQAGPGSGVGQGGGGQGQGRGMGFMMRPGIILPEPLIDQFQATAEQRAALAKLQATVDAELAKILTPVQLQALQQIGQGPQGFRQGFGGQQGFGPQGVGGQGFGVPGEGVPGFGKGVGGQGGGKGGAGQKGQGKGNPGAGEGGGAGRGR
jgi:hypothetical protein